MKKMKKEAGYSILAVILVIVSIIVAIGVWVLSGNTNIDNETNANYDALAVSIINDGTAIKSVYDGYMLTGVIGYNIIYKPGVAGTDSFPNILDPQKGISQPSVNSKVMHAGYAFPEGAWLYTNGYQNSFLNVADDPAIILFGINDKTCISINKILYGETRIPTGYLQYNAAFSMATQATPYIDYFDTEVDDTVFPNLTTWHRGCMKLENKPDANVYFQAMYR